MFRRWRGLIWSDIWNIHVNGGDDFQMIIFDLINSILNFWSRLEFWYFNSAVHTKRIKNLPKDVVILEILNCDGILTDISLITSVYSDRHGSFEMRVTSFSPICFNSWCCFYIKSINASSGSLKISLDGESMARNFLSKWSYEDIFSEVIVSILNVL